MVGAMRLTSPNFSDGERIPRANAFAVPDPNEHISYSDNRNPALEWEDVPEGTRSFALLCVDRDVPTVPDDVNQEGRTVPADLPRTEFFHWVVVDIPADTRSIAGGAYSDGGVVPHGKPGLADGPKEGVNDFTSWFEGDPDMEGTYKGYDGPCPPWNDSLIHHYEFTLYALDIGSLPVSGDFTADDVKAAMDGHVLAQASLMGTYSLNPDVG
jgi:Raf kinase inhibitor-like YbhB/YbcL family protein